MNSYLTKQLLPLLWIIVLSFYALELEKPTPVQPADAEGFSALNALPHIEIMASEVHMMGTAENRKVRDYIMAEFEKLGLETELFVGYDSYQSGNYIQLARTENIIATIKGKGDGKAVVLVAHYDSVIDSPGASDDVHAAACMLEVARLLVQGGHQNDIVFLVTDGEEQGLYGAKAFAKTKDLSNIGLVLNYEARGNSGSSISFEWSDGNGWLVEQVKEAGNRPVANSMSYEIYKRLPNGTDFTLFKNAGLAGINHAFIDGFSYYHNPDDIPENINPKSVQHTGENMFRLAKHFANTDLSSVKSENASFFNFFGSLPIYPSAWDLPLLLTTLLLVVFTIFKVAKGQKLSVLSFLKGFLSLFLGLALSGGLAFELSKLLFKFYPQYEEFYAGQFYNHKWYLVTSVGIGLLAMWLMAKWYVKKSDIASLKLSSLFILSIVTVLLYVFAPTASYFMLFPTLALTLICLADQFLEKAPVSSIVLRHVFSIVPIGVWTPVVLTLFLAFSLSGLAGSALLAGVISLGLLVAFPELWTESRLVPVVGAMLIVSSLLIGHLTSEPSESYPLPSKLKYTYNAESEKGYWSSYNKHPNAGNEQYIAGAENVPLYYPNTRTFKAKETEVKPHVPLPSVQLDSLDSSLVLLVSPVESFRKTIWMDNAQNIKGMKVNGKEVGFSGWGKESSVTIGLRAFPSDTLRIELTKRDVAQTTKCRLSSYFRSLPIADTLPANMVRGDGYSEIVQWVEL
ncbi:M28 family peptidase [Flammeovirgaceae bacterium SG7u.111]|nr:M28 family peptidase [Flammeovirgaceae bacterium SG7u.132]WPO38494.1 M28 family peptidase [Flammeovirgaceae bacterium SG7u.111]